MSSPSLRRWSVVPLLTALAAPLALLDALRASKVSNILFT
jgi:hypothetical protein